MKSITILLVLMILLTSHSLTAQTKIGLTGGATFANVTAKFDNIKVSLKARTGVTFGLFANCPLSSNFSFQPALNFVQKGYTAKDATTSDKIGYSYLEIPLNFVFNSKGFFIGAGPSLSSGLSGKEKFVDTQDPIGSEDIKIKFGSSKDHGYKKSMSMIFINTSWSPYMNLVIF